MTDGVSRSAHVGRALAVAAGAMVLGALLPPPTASAASGRCAAGTGVTVVVDFGPLRDGVGLGCDPNGGGRSGDEVMPAAGFPFEYVAGEPFVCRIVGLPDSSQESCARTPPEDKYWALFWSDGKSSTWNYSSSGLAGLRVPEGGSIGWRFQDGGSRENPSQPPTPAKQSPSPEPSRSPTPQPAPQPAPQPSKPPKPDQPSTTPGSTPSSPEGAGSAPVPAAGPDPSGGTTPAEGPGAEKRERGKGAASGKGAKERDAKGKRDKGTRDRERPPGEEQDQQSGLQAEPATVAELEPASDEPVSDGSSMLLTVVAGASVLLLVGAAGVIGWRRRV